MTGNGLQLAYISPSIGGEPAAIVAIRGDVSVTIPLTERMISLLLLQLSKEAAKLLEG